MRHYCNQEWTQYELDGGERWPENGSFKYDTIWQLLLFCQREGKRNEVMYGSAFMSLYQDFQSQMECGLWEACVMLCTEKKGKKKMINPCPGFS